MAPCVECPYCGLDLLEWPNHDLFFCWMTAEGRAQTQVEELEEIWDLDGPEEKK